jgi:NAD(P)-dependent dehydrogenase (short-subunit alcohol dehydrogenase family)
VSGATGGLGAAIVRELSLRNSRVFVTGRDASKVEALAQALGPSAAGYPADLRSAEETLALASVALASFGGIDVLINNAAVFPVKSLAEGSPADYEECFAVNVRAPYLLARAFAPAMVAAGWGRILNIGSSSAYAGFRDTSLYCASKHALLGLSRALQDELKRFGVRVICVSPGSIQTPMGRAVRGQDFSTFLEVDEVASQAVSLLEHDGSMVVDELRLSRMVVR